MNRKLIVAMFLFSLLAFSGKLFAEETAPNWQELDASQQSVLSVLESNWDKLAVTYRLNLLNGLKKWTEMSDEEVAAAEARYSKWQDMSDENRQAVQQQFTTFQKMPQDKKKELVDSYKSFKKMPSEKQKQLFEEYKAEQRHAKGTSEIKDSGSAKQSSPSRPASNQNDSKPERQQQNNNDGGGKGSKSGGEGKRGKK